MADDCIPNIGPQERRKRLRFGVILGVLCVAVGLVLWMSGVSRYWRFGLFLPLVGAASGFFQAFDKT